MSSTVLRIGTGSPPANSRELPWTALRPSAPRYRGGPQKLDGRYRAGRTVAFKLGTGQLVAVWETARVISDAVRDYCAKGGLPAKTAVFHNDIRDGVEELKWTADATGGGGTVHYKIEQV